MMMRKHQRGAVYLLAAAHWRPLAAVQVTVHIAGEAMEAPAWK